MRPVIVFKVKGSRAELDVCDKGVTVTHQAKGVVDTQWFLQFLFPEWRKMPISQGGVRFVENDSASAHLSAATKADFLQQAMRVAVIPGGLTPILQSIDVHRMYVFRSKWKHVAHEWVHANVDKKLSAAEKRILFTKFCARAWELTLQSVDPEATFSRLGYVWPTEAGPPIQPRALPQYEDDLTAELIHFVHPPKPPVAEEHPAKKQRQLGIHSFLEANA